MDQVVSLAQAVSQRPASRVMSLHDWCPAGRRNQTGIAVFLASRGLLRGADQAFFSREALMIRTAAIGQAKPRIIAASISQPSSL